MFTSALYNPSNHVSFNISWQYSKTLCVMFEYSQHVFKVAVLYALLASSSACCCNVVRIRNERNLNTTRYSAQLNSKQIDLEKIFFTEEFKKRIMFETFHTTQYNLNTLSSNTLKPVTH